MKVSKFLFYFIGTIFIILLIPLTWILMPIYYKLKGEFILGKAIIDKNWEEFSHKVKNKNMKVEDE